MVQGGQVGTRSSNGSRSLPVDARRLLAADALAQLLHRKMQTRRGCTRVSLPPSRVACGSPARPVGTRREFGGGSVFCNRERFSVTW